MSDKTGGPAFPRPASDGGRPGHAQSGMTLRDYFAAHAVIGLMGRHWSDENGDVPDDIWERWASGAYLAADAMIAEREKGGE